MAEMRQWVIYAVNQSRCSSTCGEALFGPSVRPLDYPEDFVVRGWTVSKDRMEPDTFAFVASSLQEARMIVPRGLACLPRFQDDDPFIVEVWL